MVPISVDVGLSDSTQSSFLKLQTEFFQKTDFFSKEVLVTFFLEYNVKSKVFFLVCAIFGVPILLF